MRGWRWAAHGARSGVSEEMTWRVMWSAAVNGVVRRADAVGCADRGGGQRMGRGAE
jgi:hypothetical protein